MQFILCPQDAGVPHIGLTELFLQHCQVPDLNSTKHIKALTEKLAIETTNAVNTPKGKALIKILQTHLDALMRRPLPWWNKG
jgi:hypothetical protein